VTGTFEPPSSKLKGAFSKQNWGDHSTTRTQRGHENVRRHSVFQKRIQNLKDKQWDDIFANALVLSERSHGREQKDSEDVESMEESDDGDELFDPKYDCPLDDSVMAV
jgi:hypothetical protein